ncbi:alpha/beta fold hydrolase [Altibacter sp.]|uniref:alpha/beta hydrolase family protein n=1 Tax=Altibacter sp. TaxID=2024823 RepID=UPI000C894D78|nr:alpha/beta fold hydrolase [Altibacter sp.]MAP55735.1 alpha/beta hydrolase [Altibacter sp.]
MYIEKNNILPLKNKKPILFDTYHDGSGLAKPVIIFCHGYKGFKDWGAWHLVAEAFANAGFFFLKFNFSHNGGTVDQPIDFPDLEAFAQNNFSKELEDLDRVLDYIFAEGQQQLPIDLDQIHLLAHSRGGGIALIKAEEDPRIQKVATWASVSDFRARFQEHTEAFQQWKNKGRTHIENARTKQQMPHDWQFYEDFLAHEERLTIKRAVTALNKPMLVIHGTEDTTVSEKEAQQLQLWNPKSTLHIIDGADHVFGASHPWHESQLPRDLELVIQKTVQFFR